MTEYTSLIIGGVWGLIVFAATVVHMNRKSQARNQPGKSDRDSQLVSQR